VKNPIYSQKTTKNPKNFWKTCRDSLKSATERIQTSFQIDLDELYRFQTLLARFQWVIN
jgi:hypothetical protein